MSRTYRRKGQEWDNWHIYDWEWTGYIQERRWLSLNNDTMEWEAEYRLHRVHHKVYFPLDSEKYKIGMNKFHSDGQMTMNQVPKWYKVQFCRRPFRRKEKVALIKVMKNIETQRAGFTDGSIRNIYLLDDVCFPKPVKDAMYYW